MKFSFYCSYSKNASMVRWHSWHPEVWINLLLVSILHQGMPWIKAGVPTSQSCKLHSFKCCVRLVSVHVPLVHKSSIASLARCLVSAVDFATKVCFSLFAGSEVLASSTKGNCAMCGASEWLRLLANSCCALWEVPEADKYLYKVVDQPIDFIQMLYLFIYAHVIYIT